MPQSEQQIRAQLGVPDEAQYVLIFDQAAHLDWDWLLTFENYFKTGYTPWGFPSVLEIFNNALSLLEQNPSSPGPYYYSICELGYLRRFVEYWQQQGKDVLTPLRNAGASLQIVGGGVTSPDNLLSAGEAFIRNYLVGKLWLAQNLPETLPLQYGWIPDDFGHDAELPVVLSALGMSATAFERIPGTDTNNDHSKDPDSLGNRLLRDGIDFTWSASDGSSVLAHWLAGGYGQGASISPVDPIGSINSYLQTYVPISGGGYQAAKTPYLFVPIDNDFQDPVQQLLSDLQTWNTTPGQGYAATNVYAVAASFSYFSQLVAFHTNEIQTRRFIATPYWTGHYASRMSLKTFHYAATRAFLDAEALALLSGLSANANFCAQLLAGWTAFVPSTHHDFINGTAVDDVYNGPNGEQYDIVSTALASAQSSSTTALNALATAVSVSPQAGETPFLLANTTGDAYTGVVEYRGDVPTGTQSVRVGQSWTAVQSVDGGALFFGSVPSLGYTVMYFSPEPPPAPPSVSIEGDGQQYTLTNGIVSVTVSAAANWGIESAVDVATGQQVLAVGGVGNDIVLFEDGGDLYEFGNEFQTGNNAPQPFGRASNVTCQTGTADVLETGPWRAILRTTVTLTLGGTGIAPCTYTRDYEIRWAEPFVRMTTTGNAPKTTTHPGYSVMVAFPFATTLDGIVHGTAHHWTDAQPLTYWPAPIFRATHGWLMPTANGVAQASIYHCATPAWGIDGDGVTLLGCIMRNTPVGEHFASGNDTETHQLQYALRVPSSIAPPQSGQPHAETLHYTRPPLTAPIPQSSMTFPEYDSLAGITQGTGIITAAKPGDAVPGSIVLRIYQPTNEPQSLSIGLTSRLTSANAAAITALEDPMTGPGTPTITPASYGFDAFLPTALASVQIGNGS